MGSGDVTAVQRAAQYPKPKASKPAERKPRAAKPPKKRIVFRVNGPKTTPKPEAQSWLSRLLFGTYFGGGIIAAEGCVLGKGAVETDLKDENGVVLNPEGFRITFADLEPSTEDTRKAVIYIDNLPEVFLTGKNVQDATLYLEIGTDSTLVSVTGEANPCIEGMYDPHQPDQETALPVTVTNIEVMNNRADQSQTDEGIQDLGSYCEVDGETLPPASADVPAHYHPDGILDFSLRLDLEVDMSNWTGSENVQSLIYVRLWAK